MRGFINRRLRTTGIGRLDQDGCSDNQPGREFQRDCNDTKGNDELVRYSDKGRDELGKTFAMSILLVVALLRLVFPFRVGRSIREAVHLGVEISGVRIREDRETGV